jgi:hypothetical protein
MKLSLFILGVFAALVCIEKPAAAHFVFFWHKADMATASINVRFWG